MGSTRRAAIAAMMIGAALLASACSTSPVASTSVGQSTPAAPPTTSTAAPTATGSSTPGAPITVVDPSGSAGSSASDPSTPSTTTSAPSSVIPVTTTPVTTTPATTSAKPIVKPASVTADPAFGSQTVGPLQPLKVTVAAGTLTTLKVLAADGSAIAGSFTEDRTSWTSNQRLRYSGVYTATGVATGAAGSTPTKIAGTWTVFSVSDTVSTHISPNEDAVVGVASPVIVRFGYYASDEQKAEIQRHVKITTTPKVEGAWAWFTHDGEDFASLDYRPKDFWPAGTKVTVTVDLLGVPFADGLYGARDVVTRNFTIGRNRVTYADPDSKILTVKESGRVVARYPMSMGRGDDVGDPNLVTRSGIHIVIDKKADTTMSNPAYGYKDLPEKWAVRISNNGEFIHQNLASVDAQGKRNVSHGCINLNAENAEAYFGKAVYGDPVVVTGTSVKLSASDGDYYGWALSWSDWKSRSAL